MTETRAHSTNGTSIGSAVFVQMSAECPYTLQWFARFLFSERELRSLYAIARPSVVCLSSVTFVRPTQAVQIFSNISTALGTLSIRGHPLKILRRSSQGNPSARGVKDKRGSQI